MKNTIALTATFTFILGFVIGHVAARKNIIVYSVPVLGGESRQAVHLDWPTYGLPIAECTAFLSLLNLGETNRLREQIDVVLDSALYDAAHRRPVLPTAQRNQLDKPIARAAEYRANHPRRTALPTELKTGDAWQRETYLYYSNRHETVDALLNVIETR